MARTVNTELVVVNPDTRRPVLDIDPLTVVTCGTYWVRSDEPGLVPFVAAARAVGGDIVWSGDPDRSFESACDHHNFAPLRDMVPVDGTLTNPTRCPSCADATPAASAVWFNGWDGR